MSDVALEIPRRLNDPPRMFWWEIDISLLFLAAVLAGMIAGFFVTGCAAGVLFAWAYGTASRASTPHFHLCELVVKGAPLYSHSIINGFCKSLTGLKNSSNYGGFTVRNTATSSGIPERSFHHRSTSIENSRRRHDGLLSRSIDFYRL
ncbi:MAG: type IV conjugative transfer system protein TraL [Betaproteobacteria bacterium]